MNVVRVPLLGYFTGPLFITEV